MKDQKETTRRQCFSNLARISIAGLMAAASVKLLKRKGTQEQSCFDPEGQIGCRDCSLLSGCGLPRGLSVKQFLSRKDA